jgi:Flp pilus assembly protein TadB
MSSWRQAERRKPHPATFYEAEGVKVDKGDNRPSIRTLVFSLALVGVIVLIGVVTNQAAIAALATILICGAVVAVWIIRGRAGAK